VTRSVNPGTREEPGTFTQGAPVFPGSSRLGIEPKTPGWLVIGPGLPPNRTVCVFITVCVCNSLQSCSVGGTPNKVSRLWVN
jgi:hypothetical protein